MKKNALLHQVKKISTKKVSFACPVVFLILALIFGVAFAVFQFSLIPNTADILAKLPALNLPDLNLFGRVVAIDYPLIAGAVAGLFLLVSIIAFCVQGAKKKKYSSAYGIADHLLCEFTGVRMNSVKKKANRLCKQGCKSASGYYAKGSKYASGFYKKATKSVNKFMKKNPLATLGIVAAVPVSVFASSAASAKIAEKRALKRALKKAKGRRKRKLIRFYY